MFIQIGEQFLDELYLKMEVKPKVNSNEGLIIKQSPSQRTQITCNKSPELLWKVWKRCVSANMQNCCVLIYEAKTHVIINNAI